MAFDMKTLISSVIAIKDMFNCITLEVLWYCLLEKCIFYLRFLGKK